MGDRDPCPRWWGHRAARAPRLSGRCSRSTPSAAARMPCAALAPAALPPRPLATPCTARGSASEILVRRHGDGIAAAPSRWQPLTAAAAARPRGRHGPRQLLVSKARGVGHAKLHHTARSRGDECNVHARHVAGAWRLRAVGGAAALAARAGGGERRAVLRRALRPARALHRRRAGTIPPVGPPPPRRGFVAEGTLAFQSVPPVFSSAPGREVGEGRT